MKKQPVYSTKQKKNKKNEILRYHVLEEKKKKGFSQVCLLLVSKFH